MTSRIENNDYFNEHIKCKNCYWKYQITSFTVHHAFGQMTTLLPSMWGIGAFDNNVRHFHDLKSRLLTLFVESEEKNDNITNVFIKLTYWCNFQINHDMYHKVNSNSCFSHMGSSAERLTHSTQLKYTRWSHMGWASTRTPFHSPFNVNFVGSRSDSFIYNCHWRIWDKKMKGHH